MNEQTEQQQKPKRGRPQTHGKTTTYEDRMAFNKEYKRMKYLENSEQCKKQRNLYGYKNRFEIPQKWIDKYGVELTNAILLKELQIKMGDELFNNVLNDLGEMNFPKKDLKKLNVNN
jgi:hypothetical protein